MKIFKFGIGITIAIVSIIAFYVLSEHKVKIFRALIQMGDAAGVRRLISHHPELTECDMNSERHEKLSPLTLGAALGKDEVCAVLIAGGANVNAQDKFGLTPLHKAVSIGNTNIVLMLLQHHADPLIKNGQGQTPLDFAKERISPGPLREVVVNSLTTNSLHGAH